MAITHLEGQLHAGLAQLALNAKLRMYFQLFALVDGILLGP